MASSKKSKNVETASTKTNEPGPSFRSRLTLADHVKVNMLCAGKASYHQRIIFVASHATDVEWTQLKTELEDNAQTVNRFAGENEHMSGLILVYRTHSVYMLEGSEKCIGNYMKQLHSIDVTEHWYNECRVALVYNNINQVVRIE